MSTRTLTVKLEITDQQEIFWGKCEDTDPNFEYPQGDWADFELECDFDFYGGSPEIPATWHNPGEPGEEPSVQVSYELHHEGLVVSLDDDDLRCMGINPEELETELVAGEVQAYQDDMAEDALLDRQEAQRNH